jgi:hypothetical protein
MDNFTTVKLLSNGNTELKCKFCGKELPSCKAVLVHISLVLRTMECPDARKSARMPKQKQQKASDVEAGTSGVPRMR